jgi:hypothetical protein
VYRVQREIVYQRPATVVLPPPPSRAIDPREDPRLRDYLAAVAQAPRPVASSSGRSRLSIPVTPEGPVRAIAVPDNEPAPEAQATPTETIRRPLEAPIRVEAVIAPTVQQGEPEYATPVFGRRGFVHPPGTATATEEKDKVIIDVRNYEPGEKVKDPRTGLVFLVPPTA